MARAKIPEEQVQDELPMTPMIDVIFQLVIFFMCSGHFKQIEGKLQSYLPKDKGLNPIPVLEPELREIRIILRVTPNNMVSAHVEKRPIANFPADPKKLRGIAKEWDALGAEVASLYKPSAATNRPIPVKIDADMKVPFQYVVSSLDACLRNGVKDIEFVGSGKVHEKVGTGSEKK
jgi:biopolymer transport protein ExbD